MMLGTYLYAIALGIPKDAKRAVIILVGGATLILCGGIVARVYVHSARVSSRRSARGTRDQHRGLRDELPKGDRPMGHTTSTPSALND
jgi:hypothetical protein